MTHRFKQCVNSMVFKYLNEQYPHYLRDFPFFMSVRVQKWCVVIGTISCRYTLKYHQSCNLFMKGKSVVIGFAVGFCWIFFVILYFCYILLSHGDIEVNQGPKKNCLSSFSFCHWNWNSLMVHNYFKLSSLQAYNCVYKHTNM